MRTRRAQLEEKMIYGWYTPYKHMVNGCMGSFETDNGDTYQDVNVSDVRMLDRKYGFVRRALIWLRDFIW